MQPFTLRTSVARRWPLALAGLLATVALCVVALKQIPPTWETRSSVVLIPGKSSILEGSNPLLYLGGLVQARDVLIRTVSSDQVLKPVIADAPGAAVDVQPDPTTSGPVLVVVVTAKSEAVALHILDQMLTIVPQQLSGLQNEVEVPSGARATSLVLTRSTSGKPIQKTRIRVVGALGVAGAVGTLLAVGLVDGLLLARLRRREEQVAASSDASPTLVHASQRDRKTAADEKPVRVEAKATTRAP